MNEGERPLVTFALIAYNQKSFIREAVEGALAQTYSPLEIILSDDCSTDRTYEIMKELANGYKGPHKIKLLRNKKMQEFAAISIKSGSRAKGNGISTRPATIFRIQIASRT